MEQAGGPFTVKTTSSCLEQPAVSVTVNRNVAIAGPPLTCTVAGRVVQLVQEDGASRVAPAVEETMLHAIEAMGLVPGCAVPLRVKAVESTWEHLIWALPASASPMVKSTCSGVIRSEIFAVGDCDCLVFTRMVLIPMIVQGLKAVLSISVTSTAASAKVFLR